MWASHYHSFLNDHFKIYSPTEFVYAFLISVSEIKHGASYNHQDFITSTVEGRGKFHPRTGHEGQELE